MKPRKESKELKCLLKKEKILTQSRKERKEILQNKLLFVITRA